MNESKSRNFRIKKNLQDSLGLPRNVAFPPRMASPLGATTSRSSPWAWTVTQATGWGPRGAMEAMKDGSRVKDGVK